MHYSQNIESSYCRWLLIHSGSLSSSVWRNLSFPCEGVHPYNNILVKPNRKGTKHDCVQSLNFIQPNSDQSKMAWSHKSWDWGNNKTNQTSFLFFSSSIPSLCSFRLCLCQISKKDIFKKNYYSLYQWL